jgi:hypothetical protein
MTGGSRERPWRTTGAAWLDLSQESTESPEAIAARYSYDSYDGPRLNGAGHELVTRRRRPLLAPGEGDQS